jgi:hypothetical protein
MKRSWTRVSDRDEYRYRISRQGGWTVSSGLALRHRQAGKTQSRLLSTDESSTYPVASVILVTDIWLPDPNL